MITVKQISRFDWHALAANAHLAVFNENWTPEKERIDFTLLTVDEDNKMIQYATIREMDWESSYIQYGGSFPDYRGSINSVKSFRAILDWLFERYINVSFFTENTNWPMLKFAIREKFSVISTRTFQNHVMLEHYRRREI